MHSKALVIGNSDGIGLALTRTLLAGGWHVSGISRSRSPVTGGKYRHTVIRVQNQKYPARLRDVLDREGPFHLCVYCAGIGELLDPLHMEPEENIINVNLLGMIKTASSVIPQMVRRGHGHFIGLSSVADRMVSAEAPSYHASKAGFSNYLEGLALALRSRGVFVTNIRFGFVDTKMAKGAVRPFMMDTGQAVSHILTCIRRKPVRYTAPRRIIPLLCFRNVWLGWRIMCPGGSGPGKIIR